LDVHGLLVLYEMVRSVEGGRRKQAESCQSIETYDFELRLGNSFILCVAFTLLLSFGALDKTLEMIGGKQWSAFELAGINVLRCPL
jgi:hypothetical protein